MMAHWFESWRERGSNRGTRSDNRARRKRQAYQLKVRNPKRGPLLVPVLRAGGFSRPLYTSRDWEPRVILRIRYPLPRRVLTAVATELFHPRKGDHIEVPDGILLLLRMHSGREACLLGNIVVTVIPMTRSLASKVGWFKFVRETFTGNNNRLPQVQLVFCKHLQKLHQVRYWREIVLCNHQVCKGGRQNGDCCIYSAFLAQMIWAPILFIQVDRIDINMNRIRMCVLNKLWFACLSQQGTPSGYGSLKKMMTTDSKMPHSNKLLATSTRTNRISSLFPM